MGVLLSETANGWVIVPGAEVVISGFKIQVLPAVVEGVGVKNIWVLLVAEGVVVDAGLLQ